MEYISVHDIETNKINTEVNDLVPMYQIQGIDNKNKALIMKVGMLENPNDVLIREFKIVKKYKCFMVSRLYPEKELEEDKKKKRYQMIKVIICKIDDKNNNPIGYLCFNFHTDTYEISTHEFKKELDGHYSITFHYMEKNIPKYILLHEMKEYIGGCNMMYVLTEHLYNKNVLKQLDKQI